MMTFPDWLGIADCTIKTKTVTQVAEARSFRRVARKVGGQRFEVTLKSILVGDDLIRKVFGFQSRLEGQLHPFSCVIPKYSFTQGAQVTNPKVKTTTLAGNTGIPLRLLKTGTQGCLIDGDFIRFSNHSKIYQVRDDVDSSASGLGTLTVYPALIEDVTADTNVIVNDVDFTLSLTNDVQQFSVQGNSQLTYFEFDCVEAFR